jgi:methionyl aminopeptidase
MIVRNEDDLNGMMRIGQICGHALQHMLARVEPGIRTAELDRLGAAFLQRHSARSAPIEAYDYPGWTCISINDEAAHGIPGERVIQPGDVVNIDVSAVLEGFWADTGASMLVPPVEPARADLLACTRRALQAGIDAACVNAPVYDIGKAVHRVAQEGGYKVLRELGGHGVGGYIHENPNVPNYYTRRAGQRLREGLVITIEPFLNTGRGRIVKDADGWTLRTPDKSISAQFEHTVIIAGNNPILVTQVEGSH